jgi:non-ribosomal peptide synthetase component F
LAGEKGVTLFMVLAAGFKVLLARYSRQEDICIGTPVANRHRQDLEGLIGLFVNTLVLRTKLSGEESFEQLLKRVQRTALEAYAHQDLPFERLVEELNPSRSLSHAPLFQVMLVLQNAARERGRSGESKELSSSFLGTDADDRAAGQALRGAAGGYLRAARAGGGAAGAAHRAREAPSAHRVERD